MWAMAFPWPNYRSKVESQEPDSNYGTSAECGLRLHPGRGARRQGKKRGPTNVFFATKDWIYSANLGFYMMSLNFMQVKPGKCGVLQVPPTKEIEFSIKLTTSLG